MSSAVLVLNVSYEFLNVASLERAVKLIYKGKAEIVEAIPGRQIGSSTFKIQMPSIIRLLYYICRPYKEVPFTKKNILLRDNHHCQYCGKSGNTIDHIVPKSLRGEDSWTNCVCSCIACNNRKNNRSLEDCGMKLQRKPKKPSYIPWILIKRDAMAVGWKKYLLYNISIEEFIE